MNSRNRCIRLPEDLSKAADILAFTAGYDSFTGYMIGLIRNDAVTGQSHETALKIDKMTGENRDKIDSSILERCANAPLHIEMSDAVERDKVIQMMPVRHVRLKPAAKKGGSAS